MKRRRLLGALGVVGITGASVLGYPRHAMAQARQDLKEKATASDPAVVTIKNPKTGRSIKFRARLPREQGPTGLILYSPGLGSGVSNGEAWCEVWRQAGYLVVTLAHPVTDDSLWRTSEKQSFKASMQLALAGPQYSLRVSDCSFALDHCLQSAQLSPYIDPARIGLAGHSYGALTAQTIAGQPLGASTLKDPRIKAVIAFSPGATSPERAKSMSKVDIPFFCITGDHDQFVTFKKDADAIQLGVSLANRESVFAHLPAGKKLQLKLRDADHMSFAGEEVDPKRFSRDIKVTEQGNRLLWGRVSEITTAFWEYYLAAEGRSVPATKEGFEERLRALKGPDDALKFG
ncbi:MAG: alpha/beta hydrolase fold domain-containing protein [Burkholderiaceae bacterium]|nr:alpha/beta hydrolase fold domain-containing protein [Burkholderiaceae bacterium]